MCVVVHAAPLWAAGDSRAADLPQSSPANPCTRCADLLSLSPPSCPFCAQLLPYPQPPPHHTPPNLGPLEWCTRGEARPRHMPTAHPAGAPCAGSHPARQSCVCRPLTPHPLVPLSGVSHPPNCPQPRARLTFQLVARHPRGRLDAALFPPEQRHGKPYRHLQRPVGLEWPVCALQPRACAQHATATHIAQ